MIFGHSRRGEGLKQRGQSRGGKSRKGGEDVRGTHFEKTQKGQKENVPGIREGQGFPAREKSRGVKGKVREYSGGKRLIRDEVPSMKRTRVSKPRGRRAVGPMLDRPLEVFTQ